MKNTNQMKLDFKHLKKVLQLCIKNLLILKNEPDITKIEKDASNFKIRFLYEISAKSFEKHMKYIPGLNEPRKNN